MPVFHYYTRRGCHLCEQMLEELLPLLRGKADIEMRDVDTDENWLREFDIRVPVVEYEGRVVTEFPLKREAVLELLAEISPNGA